MPTAHCIICDMKSLIVIADWASDTLTNGEFSSAIQGYAKDPNKVRVSFVSSTPSTIHTGFVLAQLVYTQERLGTPHESLYFVNTDPRLQADHDIESSQGAPFVIMRLANGIVVCGVNAGYDFSFVKPQIAELFTYPGIDKGSQFRSRDTLSRIVAHLADYMDAELELEETHLHVIPELERDTYYIGHIDNFGNLKTTMPLDALKGKHEYGDTVRVTVGKTTRDATFVRHMFAAHPGELVVYPGSSGPVEDPYVEVSVWRHFEHGPHHTGHHAFESPKPGDVIHIGQQ